MVDGKVNVIYEDNHIIVVEKPRNVLVQADNTNDLDLLTIVKKYLKEKYQDRPVGGVMVFAKTSKAARRLSESIRTHNFKKTYLAVISGALSGKGIFEDKLKVSESENKTIVASDGKDAKLEYEVIASKDNLSLVRINLITGRKHQIRVQFASRNLPLWGDQKYNSKAIVGEQIALWATIIEFVHPVSKEVMEFSLKPKDEYPWNIFKGEY